MKKFFWCSIIILMILFSGCKKKVPKIYTGSVMLYSTMENDELNAIKSTFESLYKGITLDYYYSREDRVESLLEKESSTGEFEGDVLFGFDIIKFKSFKEKGYFEVYKSKEASKFDKSYKDEDENFVAIVEDRNGKIVPIGLLKNSPTPDNGKLLIDFLLSKKCKEILEKCELKSLR